MDSEVHGPYVSAALICEKILREGDSVLSAIRMVDRIKQIRKGKDAPEKMPRISFGNLMILIGFRGANLEGEKKLTIRLKSPSGELMGEASDLMLFRKENTGANKIVSFNFETEQTGTHWFDILLSGKIMTRIPLTVDYERVLTETSSAQV